MWFRRRFLVSKETAYSPWTWEYQTVADAAKAARVKRADAASEASGAGDTAGAAVNSSSSLWF